jgi:hypothetical protein
MHYIKPGRLAKDKHSSLLSIFVNYSRKKFYKTWPRVEVLTALSSSAFTTTRRKDMAGLKVQSSSVKNYGRWAAIINLNVDGVC